MVKIVQVNLHHCKAALAALQKYMLEKDIDFALIQEPWVFKGKIRGLNVSGDHELLTLDHEHPRACLVAKKKLNFLPLWGLCCRDLMVNMMRINLEGNEIDLVIGAAYLPWDHWM